MTPAEFRSHGYSVIDWIARYLEQVESYPVLSTAQPGDVRKQLPPNPPTSPEPFERVLEDFERILLPGITHWQSPNFYAYFPSNSSGPSILGELLSAGLGVQGMLWATSPACTELETHVLDWLVDLLGLPAKFQSTCTGGGVIQDTASSATLCAVLAARERATQFQSNESGVPTGLVAYASTQAHSSVEKAIRIAGLGVANLRLIDVDDQFAMRPELLRRAMQADVAEGRRPFFTCATVGTTSTLAVDPVAAMGPICREFGAWLHVDAAMAGTAALCPEHQSLHDGVELADSYCFNPHKWMCTNFDCDCFYVADRATLIRTLSVLPEYLKNKATEAGAVFDYRDWHVPLGRRFRSLKLWFVLRSFGVAGLQKLIRHHVALTNELVMWISADERFEIVAPPRLNLVCFRLRGVDEPNERLLELLNGSGKLFLSHTKVRGQFALRLCVAQTTVEHRHVRAAWDLITATARDVLANSKASA